MPCVGGRKDLRCFKVLRVLKKYSDVILSYKVTKFDQFGSLLRLRAQVELIDGSTLYLRETVIGGTKRKYAYHWQDKDAKLIIRWDNAPDWDVETFPHHKHTGAEGYVEPSFERTLEQVLRVVAETMRRRGSNPG